MAVIAPPRPPDVDDKQDVDALEALIEEARRRARRRRLRNGGVGVLLTGAGVAAFIGFRGAGGDAAGPALHVPAKAAGASNGGDILVTMRGYVIAARTLHSAGGPAHYHEAGRFNVAWRIPASELAKPDRAFPSISATVAGTTSATFDSAPAKSCHGALTARRRPFLLRVVHGRYDAYLGAAPVGFDASPNPVATANSTTCAAGMFAGRWRLTAPRNTRVPHSFAAAQKRAREWWVYNHPGGAFYGTNFTPVPKGGASEGWIAGWGPTGSFRWVAVFSVRRRATPAQALSYRQVLQTAYAPIPSLFLKAVDPCTNNQFAACRRDDSAVKKAVERLTAALRRARVPQKLAQGDRELRQGLAALDTAVALRIRLAHQATIEAFIRADDDQIVPALNLMDKAAHDLDSADRRLQLRPV